MATVTTKRKITVAALAIAWVVIVYLRAQYTMPGELAWIVGIVSAAVVCALAGYITRGIVEAPRRN